MEVITHPYPIFNSTLFMLPRYQRNGQGAPGISIKENAFAIVSDALAIMTGHDKALINDFISKNITVCN